MSGRTLKSCAFIGPLVLHQRPCEVIAAVPSRKPFDRPRSDRHSRKQSDREREGKLSTDDAYMDVGGRATRERLPSRTEGR
jgi:hypothetical protein